MKRIEYNAVNITIPIGQTTASETVKLYEGRCIGVAFFPFVSIPAQNINIGVDSTQGNKIVAAIDVRDFLKGNGSQLESYKQTGFLSNGNVSVVANTPVAIAGTAFSGQFVFVIEVDE